MRMLFGTGTSNAQSCNILNTGPGGSLWQEYHYYDLTNPTRSAAGGPAIRFCVKKENVCAAVSQ